MASVCAMFPLVVGRKRTAAELFVFLGQFGCLDFLTLTLHLGRATQMEIIGNTIGADERYLLIRWSDETNGSAEFFG